MNIKLNMSTYDGKGIIYWKTVLDLIPQDEVDCFSNYEQDLGITSLLKWDNLQNSDPYKLMIKY